MPKPNGGQFTAMSIRDYFAAHAPRKPYPWFQPSMPPMPDLIQHEGHGPDCFDCSPVNWLERAEWVKEEARQTVIQWPYAYADIQIAQRDKE